MSELVEARDFNGELYVSATNLVEALQRARASGAEHERVRLESMLTPHERRVLRVRELIAGSGYTVEQVMGKHGPKDQRLTRIRQDVWLDLRENGMGLSEIGRFFNRDHTTVGYGIKVAKERRNGMGNTRELRQAIETAEAASAIREADSDDGHR